MSQENMLVRGTAANNELLYFSVESTQLTEKARVLHNLSPLSTVALGRVLTAAALMGSELKGDNETVTLSVKGNGPAGNILAVSDNKANVKGIIQNTMLELPLNDKGKFDVAGAVGTEGRLSVIRDLNMRDPYIGQVKLISGEIAEDVAYYYTVSQQTPSIVALGVLIDRDGSVKKAGGFMVQTMPDTTEETISALEQLVGGFPPVTYLLEQGFNAGEIMDLLLGKLGFNHTSISNAQYSCDCSRDRMFSKLVALGRDELTSIVNDDCGDKVELVCQFCGSKYNFTKDDIRKCLE